MRLFHRRVACICPAARRAAAPRGDNVHCDSDTARRDGHTVERARETHGVAFAEAVDNRRVTRRTCAVAAADVVELAAAVGAAWTSRGVGLRRIAVVARRLRDRGVVAPRRAAVASTDVET